MSLRLTLIAVGLTAWTTLALWAYEALDGDPDPRRDTVKVTHIDRPITLGDIPEGTQPDRRTEYAAPDSQDTRTDCITIPTWVDSLPRSTPPQSDSTKSGSVRESEPSAYSESSNPTQTFTASAGPPYAITPMTNGRPALSVGSRLVHFSWIDPRTGAGNVEVYRVPQPTWTLEAVGEISAGRRAALGESTLYLTHTTDWGRLSVGPSAQAFATSDGYHVQAAVSIRLAKTIWTHE